MTNAHNVAGASGPVTVQIPDGKSYKGTVVLYNPDRDVAVLRVPGLVVSPLRFQPTTHVGDSEVIVAYEGSAGFTATSASIASRQIASGPNIYQEHSVLRKIYVIRGKVTPGQSGGPLLATDGTVSGLIFAAALDEVGTGYALTVAEISSSARAGATSTAAVSTQRCSG